EWGRSTFDRRHRLNLTSVWFLPWGFQMGGILTLTSRAPFNITTGSDDNGDGVANDRPPGVTRNTGQGPGLLAWTFASRNGFGSKRPPASRPRSFAHSDNWSWS